MFLIFIELQYYNKNGFFLIPISKIKWIKLKYYRYIKIKTYFSNCILFFVTKYQNITIDKPQISKYIYL